MRAEAQSSGNARLGCGSIIVAIGVAFGVVVLALELEIMLMITAGVAVLLGSVFAWFGFRRRAIAASGLIGTASVIGKLGLGGSEESGSRPPRYLLTLEVSATDETGEEHFGIATSVNSVERTEVDAYLGKTVTVLWNPKEAKYAVFDPLG